MEMKRMSRLLKFSVLPMLTLGLVLMAGAKEADAGGFSIQIGNYGAGNYGYGNQACRGYGGYQSLRPSYGPSIYYGRSYRPSFNSYQSYGGYRSNRAHYDYHAPSLYRHGNHLDYVPGHYDIHHGGHGGYGHH